MTTQHNRRYSDGRSNFRFGAFLFGFGLALVLLVVGMAAYLQFGKLPVAAADPAFPLEAQIVHVPLNARIAKEMRQPPFGISEDVFESGAKIYRTSCASCHGSPGQESQYGRFMYPQAPQLWKKHANSAVVGVSDDPAGETFWKIKNGIRLTGMPSFSHIYTDTQMWNVALLLKNSDQPMPDPVMRLLTPVPAGSAEKALP